MWGDRSVKLCMRHHVLLDGHAAICWRLVAFDAACATRRDVLERVLAAAARRDPDMLLQLAGQQRIRRAAALLADVIPEAWRFPGDGCSGGAHRNAHRGDSDCGGAGMVSRRGGVSGGGDS